MSSKRAIRRHVCERKAKYGSRQDAAKALARRGWPLHVQIYRCRFCNQWHLGHWLRRDDS